MKFKEKRYSGCLHPLLMIRDGVNPSGKPHYKMIGSAVGAYDPKDPLHKLVPCGKCINCRLAYSRRWADRLVLESIYHEQSWFVTLTYNDFFVPESKYIDENTGEVVPHLSLYKRDVQNFLKRLREMVDYPIRFYCAGEYGSKTYRPHYHLIIFGLKLDGLTDEDGNPDLYNVRQGHSGFDLWQSHLLERAWSKILFNKVWPLGHVSVAPMNWKTAAYVARYVTKKLDAENDGLKYEDFNIEKPFSTCSRKPGIAYQYYLDHPEFAEKQKVFLMMEDGSLQIQYPKYFLKKLEVDNPLDAEYIKEGRAELGRLSYQNLDRTRDIDYYFKSQEALAESTQKKLVRNEI